MTVEEKVRTLPPQLQQEVSEFVDSLVARRAARSGRKLRQDWAGAISHCRQQFTALELQRKTLDWWGD